MANESSVLLLEFNELTPSILFDLMKEGVLPNFQRLYKESSIITTDARESGGTLNPWVQWVTVHTGLSASDHGLKSLGEGSRLQAPTLTEIVSENGIPTLVFGSMNTRFDDNLNGFVLPDPWTIEVRPSSEELDPFYDFVSAQVQGHTDRESSLLLTDYLDFVVFMMKHGLSASSVLAIVKQLVSERFYESHWKRVAILDRLQFDVFRSYYKRVKPRFATFFLNSVAHLQHYYWRSYDPDEFAIKPSADEQSKYKDAIPFGYIEMDKTLGRLCQLAGRDSHVFFCTALSQQPCLVYDEHGGKLIYKPVSIETLIKFCGFMSAYEYHPVMAEQFYLACKTQEDSDLLEASLRSLTMDGEPIMFVQRDSSTT